MRRQLIPFSFAILLGASTTVLGPLRSDDPAPVRTQMPVAVVDMQAVLNAYPGRDARAEVLDQLRADLQQQSEALQKEIEAVEADAGLAAEGSLSRRRLELDREGLINKYRGIAEYGSKLLNQRSEELLFDLQLEVEHGIADYMAQRADNGRGVGVLLRLRSEVEGDPELVLDVRAVELGRRRTHDVVYAAREVDLTTDIIRFLGTWTPK